MVVEAPDEQTALTGVQNWHAQNIAQTTGKTTTDTSMLGALSQGTADVVSGVGKTIKDYLSPSVGKAVLDSNAAKSNPKYQSASQVFMYPADGADNHTLGLDWSQAPRAMVEQAPGLALDVAGQVLTKRLGPIGQYIANAATYGARTLGSEAEKRAAARTGNEGAEPTGEDKLTAFKSVAAQAALNKIGSNSIVNPGKVTPTGIKGVAQAAGNVVKAAAVEGGTSAAQDLVSQGFVKQGTEQPFDSQEVKGALALGALGGGLFSAPRGAKEALSSARLRSQSADEHTAMAANRIIEAAGGTDSLSNPSKAYDATSRAVADVHRELGEATQRLTNPSTEAANALEAARRGEVLSKRDLAAVDAEGNDGLSSLVRQSTALSKLTDIGNFDQNSGTFVGGTHQTAKKLVWPFAKEVGKLGALAGAGAIGSGGVGLDAVTAHIPGALEGLAGAVAAYKGLKAMDKALGLASPAKTFAEKFGDTSGSVRVPTVLNQNPSGPKVTPQNSLTPSQPWGPTLEVPQPFKPDVIEPGIGRIVEKLQRQKQQQTAKDAMPLLRQLAQDANPTPEAPALDANALNEQVKAALLMASARRKIVGQQQAEAEADASPLIHDVGGLDAVRNPAMGKRASELISAANALKKLRNVPEADSTEAPTAPVMDNTPTGAEPFTLPESPYWHLDAPEAADNILKDAKAGQKPIRNEQAYHAGTVRRLKAEEDIYRRISDAMGSVKERGAFHKYLGALWGSDTPEVVRQVRGQMMGEFPQYGVTILKHLPDEVIKGLWNTKPARR